MSDTAETPGARPVGPAATVPPTESWTLSQTTPDPAATGTTPAEEIAFEPTQDGTGTEAVEAAPAVTEAVEAAPAVIVDESLILVDPMPVEGALPEGPAVCIRPRDDLGGDAAVDDVEAGSEEGIDGELIFTPAVMPEGWEELIDGGDPAVSDPAVTDGGGEGMSGEGGDAQIFTCWMPVFLGGEDDSEQTLEMRTLMATSGLADGAGSGAASDLSGMSFMAMPQVVRPFWDSETADPTMGGASAAPTLIYGSFDLGFSAKMIRQDGFADLSLLA